MKKILLYSLVAFSFEANAANVLVSNVVAGPGDTLYANASGGLASSGLVTIGYFTAGFDPVTNLGDYAGLVANYTVLSTRAFGQPVADLGGGVFPGYVQGSTQPIGTILAADPLFGRGLYSFVGNAADLGSSSAAALIFLQNIASDSPVEQSYSANPVGRTPLIGTVGTFTGNASGFGSAAHPTLQLAAVPEPSTLLLSAFGVLGLLRRKR